MRFRKGLGLSAIGASLALVGSGCQGTNNSAASDLLNAFQSGCSLNGSYLQMALSQTQSLVATIQDLQSKNSCSGLNGALSSTQGLQGLVGSMVENQVANSLSSLAPAQQALLLQMQQTTDPDLMSVLASQYSANLTAMAGAETAAITATGGILPMTSFQRGSVEASNYVSQLMSDQANLTACAQDNPAMAAQLAAGMLGVAGSFMPTTTGLALSLAGGVVSSILAFVHDSGYQDAIDQLDKVQMATALPCGLEQMSNVYCQAQDLMDINHLEECAYNPHAPDCNVTAQATPTNFWKGLDVMVRDLPALQLWITQVVTGVTPSDPAEAKQMNDAADAVLTMDDVSRLAQGIMKQEEKSIGALASPADQDKELRRGLALLQAVLAFDVASADCVGGGGFGGCTNGNRTPILTTEGTAAQILYDLVYPHPVPSGCNPASTLNQGTCEIAATIGMPPAPAGSTGELGIWSVIESNAGGLPNALPTGKHLIDGQLSLAIQIERQFLNTDPSDVLEKVNIPAGVGLPPAIKALHAIDGFLQASHDSFSDLTQVPDALLDGGAMMRPGILGNLAESKKMVDSVIASLAQMNGSVTDLDVLNDIYKALNLAKDRNFLYNRLYDQVSLDVHTRIRAGQVPTNVYDILSQAEIDPTVGLTQIPPEAMETTKAQLGQAQTTSQANLQQFADFFKGGFEGVLEMLKKQADQNDEPMIANPRIAPTRSAQARICLLLATTQSGWPDSVNVDNCKGLAYVSELTGKALSFDDYYSQMQDGRTTTPQRMCEFYHFYRLSQNYTHEHPGH